MQTRITAVFVLGLAAASATVVWPAAAQTSTSPGPDAAAGARPARGPEQSSVPSAAPPADTRHTTGAHNQDPTVKAMNEAERRKVEAHGK